jgi:HK97 family phage prohead protease
VPYYITEKSEDCPSWAVVKENGELIACHDSKQSAIDQAVAISLAEKTDFLGERAAVGSLNVGDWVSWSPLDPTVLGQVEMVQDQFAVVEIYEYEQGIFHSSDKYMLLNVFKLEKVPAPAMLAVELEHDPQDLPQSLPEDLPHDQETTPMERMTDLANTLIARINSEESMTKENKWLDVARAIQLKIDGTQPESKEPEVRVNSTKFEVRAEGDGMTFTGYASVFNSPSEDLGGFIEYVAPGAFKRSLQSRNEVKLLWNHDSGEPLASLRGGTMQLVEDEIGLKVTAQLPNTSRGRDVAELLRTKVIDSMSFGFNVIKDSWSRDGQTRTLESVRLFETSIVSFPAYSSTTATVRSAPPTINADDLAEALLKLESGEQLDEASANLITEVVAKLKSNPDVEEVIDNGLDLLDLKKKQFDLLLKRI